MRRPTDSTFPRGIIVRFAGGLRHWRIEGVSPAGLQPVVVTYGGGTIVDAVDGAVEKMEKLLDHTFAKLHHPKGRTSLGEAPTV